MPFVPPRLPKLLNALLYIGLFVAILIAGSVVYQISNPNAGMLNCPPGTFKVMVFCYDLGCGKAVLVVLGSLLFVFALLTLICHLINPDNESQKRLCREMLRTITLMLINLMAFLFLAFCHV